jgi:hypothetical protein
LWPRAWREVFDLGPVGIVDDLSIQLVADAEDFIERLALSKLND